MQEITFSGLASGLPSDLVDRLVELQQRPLTRLADRRISEQTRLSAVQDFNARLLTMKSSMEALDAPADFQSRIASSSDDSFVSFSASGTAALGTYSVTNVTLADNHQLRQAAGVASRTTPLSGGTFAFTYGTGTEQQVTLAGGETLDDLVTKINDLNVGVNATVINDGTSDYLVLTGNDTGAANSVVVTANTTLLGFESVDFTTTSTASDASFQLDGLTITGASNDFTTAVDGLTINLNKATAGETLDLTVSKDSDTLINQVQAFVDAYNGVAEIIDVHSQFDVDSGRRTVLFGDSSIRSIESQMRRLITTPVSGLSGPYTTLAELGVTTQTADGSLVLDRAVLQKAIDADSEGVAKVFYEDTNTGVTGLSKQFVDYLDQVTDGVTGLMQGKIDSIDISMKALDRQIQSTQRQVDIISERIRGQFASLEVLISNMQSNSNGALASLGALVQPQQG